MVENITPLIDTIFDCLGESGWLTGTDTQRYERDWLNRYGVSLALKHIPGLQFPIEQRHDWYLLV
ncbi:hypothetical protein BA893_24175 [Vibrio natriegens]|uniref:hypothetical protein n=1 Tax=Vibrio natriegens TaxID=691 RepID=UPI00080440A3|nr:hypothetical protein [Vibrio natriegens]ANQ24692.1 hypothetical protein BA893_24175 [Vibrio natriegens]